MEYVIYESKKKQSDHTGKLRSAPIAADNLRARAVLERAGWKLVETSDTDAVTETVEVAVVPDAVKGFDWREVPLTEAQWKALFDAGYGTDSTLKAATDAELQAVHGIGAATVRNIRKALRG